jgi:hypothetical protein
VQAQGSQLDTLRVLVIQQTCHSLEHLAHSAVEAQAEVIQTEMVFLLMVMVQVVDKVTVSERLVVMVPQALLFWSGKIWFSRFFMSLIQEKLSNGKIHLYMGIQL